MPSVPKELSHNGLGVRESVPESCLSMAPDAMYRELSAGKSSTSVTILGLTLSDPVKYPTYGLTPFFFPFLVPRERVA